MRDIAVLLFLIACIGATLRRAWLGVLALAVFSYLSPHTYCWGFMRSVPAYKILFFAVCLSFLNDRNRQEIPKDWRIPAFFFLWAYFLFTTFFARVPEYAWPKFWEVSKVYAPFIFTLTLINTRKKLFYLVCTIAASFGLVAVKGGVWSLLNGFHFRVYGPPYTAYYDNNDFAVATNVALPLLILWIRETKVVWLRRALIAAVPLCICSSLASWSRGGLLSLSAVLAFLIWNSKRKWLAVPLLALGIYLVIPLLPQEWFGRMNTIEAHKDLSSQQRLAVWHDGIQWTTKHPILGCGFKGWWYVTSAANDSYYVRHLAELGVEVRRIDWHSSYVEIFAEHGVIAGTIWLSLLAGTMVSLTRLARLSRRHANLEWVKNYALMLRAALIAYAAGTLFLGLPYWDLFYHLVFVSVLVKKFALQEAITAGVAAATPTDLGTTTTTQDLSPAPAAWRPPIHLSLNSVHQ